MLTRSLAVRAAVLATGALAAVACVPDPVTPPGSTTTTAAPTTTTVPVPGFPHNESVVYLAGVPVPAMQPSMTPDARYVAFTAYQETLVPGFTPPWRTVYRVDRTTGAVAAVSVGMAGEPSNEASLLDSGIGQTGISDDGRYVLFTSHATNLTPDPVPTNRYNVYVRDMTLGVTTLVSKPAPGGSNTGADMARISHNGEWVTFRAPGGAFGPVDTNGVSDVYRWQRSTGAIVRVSVGLDAGSNVVESNAASQSSVPLNDGRVVFASKATNIEAGVVGAPVDYLLYIANPTTRAVSKVGQGILHYATFDGHFVMYSSGSIEYLRDTVTNAVEPALTTAAGATATGSLGAVTPDGRYVITRSGSGIIPGDVSTLGGSYLRDRVTGTKYRISVTATGDPSPSYNNIQEIGISDDGKWFVFDSQGNSYLTGATGTSPTWSVISRTPLP